MTNSPQFLKQLDTKLWNATGKLRANPEVAPIGEIRFIDTRKPGDVVARVVRAFTDEDTAQVVSTDLATLTATEESFV